MAFSCFRPEPFVMLVKADLPEFPQGNEIGSLAHYKFTASRYLASPELKIDCKLSKSL